MKLYLEEDIDFKNLEESIKKAIPIYEIDDISISKYKNSIVKIKDKYYVLKYYEDYNIGVCKLIKYEENPGGIFGLHWTCPYCGYVDKNFQTIYKKDYKSFGCIILDNCCNCGSLMGFRVCPKSSYGSEDVIVSFDMFPSNRSNVIHLE